MNELVTYLVSGVALGSSFALIGSGFVVVHRVTRVVNFAQGSLAVVGGMLSAVPAGPATSRTAWARSWRWLLCGLVGLLVGFVAIGKRGTPPLISLIITLGASILVCGGDHLAVGPGPRLPAGPDRARATCSAPRSSGSGSSCSALTLVAFAALALFFSRTYVGKALTASASNPYAARLVGIDVRRMGLLAFAIAGVLGGLAGVLIAPSNAAVVLLRPAAGTQRVRGRGLRRPRPARCARWSAGSVWVSPGELTAGYLDGSYQTEVALLLMLLIMIVRSRSFVPEEAK